MSSSTDGLLEVEGFLKGEILMPGGRLGVVPFPDGLEMLIPGGRLGTGDMEIEIPGGSLETDFSSLSLL